MSELPPTQEGGTTEQSTVEVKGSGLSRTARTPEKNRIVVKVSKLWRQGLYSSTSSGQWEPQAVLEVRKAKSETPNCPNTMRHSEACVALN